MRFGIVQPMSGPVDQLDGRSHPRLRLLDLAHPKASLSEQGSNLRKIMYAAGCLPKGCSRGEPRMSLFVAVRNGRDFLTVRLPYQCKIGTPSRCLRFRTSTLLGVSRAVRRR